MSGILSGFFWHLFKKKKKQLLAPISSLLFSFINGSRVRQDAGARKQEEEINIRETRSSLIRWLCQRHSVVTSKFLGPYCLSEERISRGQKTFSARDQVINILGLVDNGVSAAITQLCRVRPAKILCKWVGKAMSNKTFFKRRWPDVPPQARFPDLWITAWCIF